MLNEISLPFGPTQEAGASGALVEFATSIAALVAAGLASNILRMVQPLHELSLIGGISVYDGLLRMLRDPAGVEASRLLMRLSQKCPLLSDVDAASADRFHALDTSTFAPRPLGLLFSFASGSISVSFASSAVWDAELVELEVMELDSEGELATSVFAVDNVARPSHAKALVDQARARVALEVNTRDFWERQSEIFECLKFGEDVEGHVAAIDEASFRLVLTRLRELDECVMAWRRSGAAFPAWRSHVSPESATTMNNLRLAALRVFRDSSGDAITCSWHARYGSGGRIHFAMDVTAKAIVVGYIGPHLPLN